MNSRFVGRGLGAIALVAAPFLAVSLSSPADAASVSRGSVVYATNLNANSVSVINPSTHSVSSIRSVRGALGIAIAPNARTVYVTNSLGDTVTPIDVATPVPTAETPITVGSGPAAIAITPNGATAYVTDFNGNEVTPIDLTTSPPTPEPPIAVGNGPWSIAVSSNGETICVSNTEGTTVSVIDTATNAATTVDVGSRPEAIAVSGNVAYVADATGVTPIDLTTSPPTPEPPISLAASPVGIAVIPNGKTAYTANANGTVTPIDLTTSPPTAERPIAVGALTQPDGISVSPDGDVAYTANANKTVTPINLTTSPPTPETPIAVGASSFGVAVAPDQAPIAVLHVRSALAGHETTLSAAGSRSLDGGVTRYEWRFGDGTTAVTTTPTTTHRYVRSGAFRASVTETSEGGTSIARTFTGQTVSNNGASSAQATVSFKIAAALSISPPTGSPGVAVTVRDTSFTSACATVDVFFGGNLVGQTSAVDHVVDDPSLVIPGDAAVGAHRIALACPSGPMLIGTAFQVVATSSHLSEFSVSMPSPAALKQHALAAGLIGLLTLLLARIIMSGFPSEWLDKTYANNHERISARARKSMPWLFIDRAKSRSFSRRLAGGTALFLAFVAVSGLINSFLVPTFGMNETTLWLYLGMCVGIGVVTIVNQVPIAIAGIMEKRQAHLHVMVGGMVIALICVVASRALNLSPGYCYGLIAVYILSPLAPTKVSGRHHAIASVCVLIVSAAAYLLAQPVFRAATAEHPSSWLLVLNPALNVVFVGGFTSLAFSMFPLPFLPGQRMYKWNRPIWLVLALLAFTGFLVVLLAPGSGSPKELHFAGLIPMVVTFVVFAVISLGFMAYFHLRPTPHVHSDEISTPDELVPAHLVGSVEGTSVDSGIDDDWDAS